MSPHSVPPPPREIYGSNSASSAFPSALGQYFSLPGDYLRGPGISPSPHPLPSRQWIAGEKGEGIALGTRCKDVETLPLYPPSFPSSRCTAGKTPACSRGRQPRTVGADINQTPRSPSPIVLSLQPSFQFLPVSLASRNLGSVPLTGTPSSTTQHSVWNKGVVQLMMYA